MFDFRLDVVPEARKLRSYFFTWTVNIFTGHMEGCCENASQELAADETKTVGAAFFCERVHFKAIDLTLGNMLCLLTGAGNYAMSQVPFPLQDLSFSLSHALTQSITLCLLLSLVINKVPQAVWSKLTPTIY